MTPSEPACKIHRDRFEIRQGTRYVSIDRSRIDAVHYYAGVLTVRYRERGSLDLDCAKLESSDLTRLLKLLQTERDRNYERARREGKKQAILILPA